MSFHFMAAFTIYSDFGTPKNRLSLFPLFPSINILNSVSLGVCFLIKSLVSHKTYTK